MQRCRRLCAALMCLLAGGCSINPTLEPANQRAFDFTRDAFAFDNEVEWMYDVDPQKGTTRFAGENRAAQYTRHCFVLSRSARQFFQFARFDPGAPALDEAAYRDRVREVVSHDPSEPLRGPRVVIPGYASLRSFSRDFGPLLKDELGSAVQSYLQRGNWRMVFPFSREHQEKTAEVLASEIAVNRPPVVHLATFPDIQINHAILLYAARQTPGQIRFEAYDPNDSRHATPLVYDRNAKRFSYATTNYFAGGPVDVYEVYRSALY
jgi:hypothetical protein